jgi:16S rRNA (cytosine967-C5)-methyltransferase
LNEQLLSELDHSGIEFERAKEFDNAVSFIPETDLLNLKSFQKGGFEIQDLSSQVAGSMIPAKDGETWWDCCAGAGGKSLQLLDRIPGIKIFATDKRQSVLDNFKERLKRNGKKGVSMMEIDLEKKIPAGKISGRFDGIIADLPCTGSGTWARNPESLVYFNPETIKEYVERQKSILSNIMVFLKDDGGLAYITCSVFRQENEEILEYLIREYPINIERQELVNGIYNKADSMFVAILRKKTVL